MKKLIKKVAFFSIIFLLGILVLDFVLNQKCNKIENFKIETHKNRLILGNSHAQYALNDTLIENSQSFAQIAESYLYTFYKLKKMKEANKQIDTVLLSISNDSFKKEVEDTFTFGKSAMIEKFPKYSFLLPFDVHRNLLQKNPSAYLIAYIEAIKFKFNFKKSSIKKNNFWGNYVYRVEDIYPNWILELKKEQKNTKKSEEDYYFSKLNVTYLLKIVDFCQKNEMKLILIKTPLHKLYPLHNNKKYELLFNNRLKNVTCWDYGNLALKDDEFADGSHLNYKGAKKLSILINSKLKGNEEIN